ncbi:hypothetical protein M231_05278 [Tremella mesenterica]|uniref:Uncharacterized protein n=1 Tax=Tremella mesenterica TaxID=5217 RepID=A0A4Q1BIH0_TREME|nr:hypothetical protein M231_05278 [Tremella mesenterica]
MDTGLGTDHSDITYQIQPSRPIWYLSPLPLPTTLRPLTRGPTISLHSHCLTSISRNFHLFSPSSFTGIDPSFVRRILSRVRSDRSYESLQTPGGRTYRPDETTIWGFAALLDPDGTAQSHTLALPPIHILSSLRHTSQPRWLQDLEEDNVFEKEKRIEEEDEGEKEFPLISLPKMFEKRYDNWEFLTTLSLTQMNGAVNDESIMGLRWCTHLTVLWTRGCGITDAGVRLLAGSLDLPGNFLDSTDQVATSRRSSVNGEQTMPGRGNGRRNGGTREGIKGRGMWKLRAWYLPGCKGISDKSMKVFARWPGLVLLDVRDTSCTEVSINIFNKYSRQYFSCQNADFQSCTEGLRQLFSPVTPTNEILKDLTLTLMPLSEKRYLSLNVVSSYQPLDPTWLPRLPKPSLSTRSSASTLPTSDSFPFPQHTQIFTSKSFHSEISSSPYPPSSPYSIPISQYSSSPHPTSSPLPSQTHPPSSPLPNSSRTSFISSQTQKTTSNSQLPQTSQGIYRNQYHPQPRPQPLQPSQRPTSVYRSDGIGKLYGSGVSSIPDPSTERRQAAENRRMAIQSAIDYQNQSSRKKRKKQPLDKYQPWVRKIEELDPWEKLVPMAGKVYKEKAAEARRKSKEFVAATLRGRRVGESEISEKGVVKGEKWAMMVRIVSSNWEGLQWSFREEMGKEGLDLDLGMGLRKKRDKGLLEGLLGSTRQYLDDKEMDENDECHQGIPHGELYGNGERFEMRRHGIVSVENKEEENLKKPINPFRVSGTKTNKLGVKPLNINTKPTIIKSHTFPSSQSSVLSGQDNSFQDTTSNLTFRSIPKTQSNPSTSNQNISTKFPFETSISHTTVHEPLSELTKHEPTKHISSESKLSQKSVQTTLEPSKSQSTLKETFFRSTLLTPSTLMTHSIDSTFLFNSTPLTHSTNSTQSTSKRRFEGSSNTLPKKSLKMFQNTK